MKLENSIKGRRKSKKKIKANVPYEEVPSTPLSLSLSTLGYMFTYSMHIYSRHTQGGEVIARRLLNNLLVPPDMKVVSSVPLRIDMCEDLHDPLLDKCRSVVSEYANLHGMLFTPRKSRTCLMREGRKALPFHIGTMDVNRGLHQTNNERVRPIRVDCTVQSVTDRHCQDTPTENPVPGYTTTKKIPVIATHTVRGYRSTSTTKTRVGEVDTDRGNRVGVCSDDDVRETYVALGTDIPCTLVDFFRRAMQTSSVQRGNSIDPDNGQFAPDNKVYQGKKRNSSINHRTMNAEPNVDPLMVAVHWAMYIMQCEEAYVVDADNVVNQGHNECVELGDLFDEGVTKATQIDSTGGTDITGDSNRAKVWHVTMNYELMYLLIRYTSSVQTALLNVNGGGITQFIHTVAEKMCHVSRDALSKLKILQHGTIHASNLTLLLYMINGDKDALQKLTPSTKPTGEPTTSIKTPAQSDREVRLERRDSEQFSLSTVETIVDISSSDRHLTELTTLLHIMVQAWPYLRL